MHHTEDKSRGGPELTSLRRCCCQCATCSLCVLPDLLPAVGRDRKLQGTRVSSAFQPAARRYRLHLTSEAMTLTGVTSDHKPRSEEAMVKMAVSKFDTGPHLLESISSFSCRVGSRLTSTGLQRPKSDSFMCPRASSSRLSGLISLLTRCN